MGNQMAKPALEVYNAVLHNDVDRLEELVSSLKNYLNWTDLHGMNPLLVAASKNHFACVVKLLENGVDLQYYNRNPSPKFSGGALHAATRHSHERLARLFLSRGCNPFICNSAGNNCLHEAMRSGSLALLRLYEAQAPWHGQLSVKTSSLGGLFRSWKPGYMVICPLLPAPNTFRPAPMERELWIYEDDQSLVPKLRINLTNATLERTTCTDVLLRFHPKHKVKSDICIKKDQQGASCLQLRCSPDATNTLDSLIAALGQAMTAQEDVSNKGDASQASGSEADASPAAEDNLCVICLSAPKEAGYLHADTVHKCVCRQCCYNISLGKPCPVCRQRVERIVDVF